MANTSLAVGAGLTGAFAPEVGLYVAPHVLTAVTVAKHIYDKKTKPILPVYRDVLLASVFIAYFVYLYVVYLR